MIGDWNRILIFIGQSSKTCW